MLFCFQRELLPDNYYKSLQYFVTQRQSGVSVQICDMQHIKWPDLSQI